jgi:hypothetical protein
MRKHIMGGLAGMGVRGQHPDVDCGMTRRDANEVGACVTRRSDDAYPYVPCGHDRPLPSQRMFL